MSVDPQTLVEMQDRFDEMVAYGLTRPNTQGILRNLVAGQIIDRDDFKGYTYNDDGTLSVRLKDGYTYVVTITQTAGPGVDA